MLRLRTESTKITLDLRDAQEILIVTEHWRAGLQARVRFHSAFDVHKIVGPWRSLPRRFIEAVFACDFATARGYHYRAGGGSAASAGGGAALVPIDTGPEGAGVAERALMLAANTSCNAT